uniref:30S ribosomal protein S18 n=1 Tax=Nephromyces sp. ex Molgula occidentalis TaxID=2544991 RepID=A0A5C1H8H5_9APIC|nr:hypothetical protein [Nephromyces sp. ex Molgula occidentalis]
MSHNFINFSLKEKKFLSKYYLTNSNKLKKKKITKLTNKKHKFINKVIKQFRFLGLLPFLNNKIIKLI